jgi:hypothetical protein
VPSLRDTFNELMGELDYPMFLVPGGPRAGASGLGVNFVPAGAEPLPFHRAKRIEPGHPA